MRIERKKPQNLRHYATYSTQLLKILASNNKEKIAQKTFLIFLT